MDWAVPHIVVSTASNTLFNSAIDSGQKKKKKNSFPQKYTFAEMHPRPHQHSLLTTEKCRYHYTAE